MEQIQELPSHEISIEICYSTFSLRICTTTVMPSYRIILSFVLDATLCLCSMFFLFPVYRKGNLDPKWTVTEQISTKTETVKEDLGFHTFVDFESVPIVLVSCQVLMCTTLSGGDSQFHLSLTHANLGEILAISKHITKKTMKMKTFCFYILFMACKDLATHLKESLPTVVVSQF